MNQECKYEGCNNTVVVNQECCVFHAPKNKKGIPEDEFNKAVTIRIHAGETNFEGYIFPSTIDIKSLSFPHNISFKDAVFHGSVDFSHCEFKGNTNFDGAKFWGGVNFEEARFYGKARFVRAEFAGATKHQPCTAASANFLKAIFEANTTFGHAAFSGPAAVFQEAKFRGNEVSFCRSEFTGGKAIFWEAEFTGQTTIFQEAKFAGGEAQFLHTVFSSNLILFSGAQFTGGVGKFSGCSFTGKTDFWRNVIAKGLDFTDAHFDPATVFRFADPIFEQINKSAPRIVFRRNSFNPFQTFFENVTAGDQPAAAKSTARPVILFRHCQIKNVYFTQCDMTLFSFYRSAFFEESFFTSSSWLMIKDKIFKFIPTFRRLQICEESFYEHFKSRQSKSGIISQEPVIYADDFPSSYAEIAELYQRFKTAADRAKDYHLAGQFYLNEFEAKRRHIIEEAKKGSNWLIRRLRLAFSGRLWLYRIYKIFAGYGEKPLRSFLWFFIFSLVFALIHLHNCLQPYPPFDTIHYNISHFFHNIKTQAFWADFVDALVFTVSRVVPVNYFSSTPSHLQACGDYGHTISFINSLTLIILVIFIMVGLKRHFRRF